MGSDFPGRKIAQGATIADVIDTLDRPEKVGTWGARCGGGGSIRLALSENLP
jgi:hypothetical protein